jgi:hypothetical protein
MWTAGSITVNFRLIMAYFGWSFHISDIFFKIIFSLLERLVIYGVFHEIIRWLNIFLLCIYDLMSDSIFN